MGVIELLDGFYIEVDPLNYTLKQRYSGSTRDGGERAAIIEELADVQIMVWQLQYFLGAIGEIEKEIDRKLARQMKRIEEERAANGRK